MSGAQGELFGGQTSKYPKGPGAAGATTSIAAAVSIRPRLAPIQAVILAFLRERGMSGATYSEIMEGCELKAPTVCGRMVELVEARLVKVLPNTTRSTPSGRQARVYIVSEQ